MTHHSTPSHSPSLALITPVILTIPRHHPSHRLLLSNEPTPFRVDHSEYFTMRFSTVAACLSVCLAPASAMSIFNGKAPDVAVNDDLKIPGDSPLELCPGDHAADLIKIDSVDLLPNPPKA